MSITRTLKLVFFRDVTPVKASATYLRGKADMTIEFGIIGGPRLDIERGL
jgi:hypothetical protein